MQQKFLAKIAAVQDMELKYERVVVHETAKLNNIPRPIGHCLIPWKLSGIYLSEDQAVLLEEINCKELVEPYDILTFEEFHNTEKDGKIEVNGKKYKVYCSCYNGSSKVEKGESIFIRKEINDPKLFSPATASLFPQIVLEHIFPFLDCLDLVSAASTCRFWWNTANYCEYGRQMLEAAPTVKGFKEIVETFRKLGPPCDRDYVRKACENLVHNHEIDGKKLNILPVHKLAKNPLRTRKGEEGEEEEEEQEEEEEEEDPDPTKNVGESWKAEGIKSAGKVRLPVDILECYKLYDGGTLGTMYSLHLYFLPLKDVCNASHCGDDIHNCDPAGEGRSSLTMFGGEGEQTMFLVNIDVLDPCYGYIWLFVSNCFETSLFCYSFSDLIYGILIFMRTPEGKARLEEGGGTETDLEFNLPTRSKWRKSTENPKETKQNEGNNGNDGNKENEENEGNEEDEENDENDENEEGENKSRKRKKPNNIEIGGGHDNNPKHFKK